MKLFGISTDDLHNPTMLRAFLMRLGTSAVGIAIAVAIGYWLGIGDRFYLTCFGAILATVSIVFGMQRKAWILIPLTWILIGSISKLPVPFSVRDLGVLFASMSFVAYRVLSQESMRPKLHILDYLVGLNVIYLGLNLFINPVGFALFGAQTIGARPILNNCIAVMAYWVIIRLPNSIKEVSRIPYYMLLTATLLSSLNLLAFLVPSVGSMVSNWYTGLDAGSTGIQMNTEVQRLFGLRHFGYYLMIFVCAYYSPITLFDPRRVRFYAMLLAIATTLATGFRNLLLWAIVALALGGLLYRRWRELVIAGICGTLLLGVLIAGQGRFYELPNTMQRSLAFLPGQWSERTRADAEGSSTWRFELWKKVIDERLIKDRWFGDGFGANIDDLIATHNIQGGYSDFVTLTGAFHSGPLTAVRYVGIFGLLLLYLLSITAAFYSYKCVNECRGTPLFPVAAFFAIQLIWGPIHYTFVFGGYDAYLPDLLFQVACLRLIFRMADKWKQNAASKAQVALSQPTATVPA